jgi:PAS domain S-box-containing protein
MTESERTALEQSLGSSPFAEDLKALSAESGEAAAFLEMLAAAFFPGGGGVDRVTWPENQHDRGSATESRVPKDPRELAEARLHAAEIRFRTLIEQIPAVTFMAVLGEGENEIYVSPHIEQLLGFTQQEWLDNPFLWYWQLHPDDRAMWNDEFARGCRAGGPFRAECRFLARDGHIVWVHGEARVIKDELGRPMFLQGVAFDITESKRAQEILVRDAVRRAKFEEELAIARRVQTSILPRDLRVEGLTIAASMIPAEDVGGDYYDVFPFAGGGWLAIGDVSGHGLDAGVVMLMAQSALAALVNDRPTSSPAEIVCALNEVLYDNVRSRLRHNDHVTFSLLKYTSGGRIVFAGAHEYLLVVRARTRSVEHVRTPGTWLAATRDIRRVTSNSELVLEHGDLLVVYTDGVTEAMNEAQEQFEIERLTRTVLEVAEQPPEAVVEHVVAAVRAFMAKQFDDISLLAARFDAAPADLNLSRGQR